MSRKLPGPRGSYSRAIVTVERFPSIKLLHDFYETFLIIIIISFSRDLSKNHFDRDPSRTLLVLFQNCTKINKRPSFNVMLFVKDIFYYI